MRLETRHRLYGEHLSANECGLKYIGEQACTKNLSTSRTNTSVLRCGETVPSLTGTDGTMQRGAPRRFSTCATGRDCGSRTRNVRMLHTLEEVEQTSSNLQNAQRVQGYYMHRRRQANDAHIVKQRDLGTKRFELARARQDAEGARTCSTGCRNVRQRSCSPSASRSQLHRNMVRSDD